MFDINNNLLYYGISVRMVKRRMNKIGGFNNEEKNRGLRLLTKYWVKY
jgi:hypothetical protein